jgi:death on curing protein
MLACRVTTVGSSVGFILPKAAQERLKVGAGDVLYLTEAPDGGYRLTPYSPDFERQMSLAETIMREDRDVLRALAKLTGWRWIDPAVVWAVQEYQLAGHGGLDGVPDQRLIESALARPQNLAAYGEPDAAAPAATYAYRLARNHGFAGGNKRTAWVVARVFLAGNGFVLQFAPVDAARLMACVAAGTIEETDVADWFRAKMQRR